LTDRRENRALNRKNEFAIESKSGKD